MARWTKLAATLVVILIPSLFVTPATLGATSASSPDVKIHVTCPNTKDGPVVFTVHPWLYEVKANEPGIWLLTINNPDDNELKISAKGDDPDNWGYKIDGMKGDKKVVIDYSEADQKGSTFGYNITFRCEMADFEVVVDPLMIIG